MRGYTLELLRPHLPFKSYNQFRFLADRNLEFRLSAIVDQRRSTTANVKQCPQCQVKVGRGPGYRGILWNRVSIHYHSKVISCPGLVAAILNRLSTTQSDIDVVILRSVVV